MQKWDQIYKKYSPPWIEADIPIDQLEALIRRSGQSPTIIDFGCGDGRLSRQLAQRGARVFGADCSFEAIKKTQPQKNVSYLVASSFSTFRESASDAVLMWGLLHHYNPSLWPLWMQNAFAAVRPHGTILIGVFHPIDVKFGMQTSRRSLTTNDTVYVNGNRLLELETFCPATLCETGMIQLSDGDRTLRTWAYYLCRKT